MSRMFYHQNVDNLAMNSARVLSQFGIENPDWSEWVDLKNALLKVQPQISKNASNYVGKACATFQDAARRQK